MICCFWTLYAKSILINFTQHTDQLWSIGWLLGQRPTSVEIESLRSIQRVQNKKKERKKKQRRRWNTQIQYYRVVCCWSRYVMAPQKMCKKTTPNHRRRKTRWNQVWSHFCLFFFGSASHSKINMSPMLLSTRTQRAHSCAQSDIHTVAATKKMCSSFTY